MHPRISNGTDQNPATSLWTWRILLSTYAGYAGFYLTRNIFPVCKKAIANQFNLDWQQVGHIWTAYLAAYALGMLLVSILGRRASARWLLLTGLGVSIGVCLLFGMSQTYPQFVGFMIVNGLVQALGWPGSLSTVSAWLSPAVRAPILGIWSTNLLIGNMLVKSAAGTLLGMWGWKYAFVGCSVLAMGIWALLYFWQRNTPEDAGLKSVAAPCRAGHPPIQVSSGSRMPLRDYAQLLLHPVVFFMAAAYFAIKFLRYAADSWLPTFLQLHGLQQTESAFYSTIYDLGGLPGMILIGYFVMRFFRGQWAPACAFLSIGLIGGYFALSTLSHSPIQIAVCYGFIGFFLYAADSLLKGLASMEVAGERNSVAVAGLVNGIASVGPIVAEEWIGYLMKDSAPAAGVHRSHECAMFFTVVFTVSTVMVWWICRRRASHHHPGTHQDPSQPSPASASLTPQPHHS